MGYFNENKHVRLFWPLQSNPFCRDRKNNPSVCGFSFDLNEFLHLSQTVYIYEGTGRLVWKFQAISDVYILYSLPELCKHLYFCVFFYFLFLFSLFAFGVFLLVNLYLISWYITLFCVVAPSRNQGSKTMQIRTHPLRHIMWFLTLSVHHSVRI